MNIEGKVRQKKIWAFLLVVRILLSDAAIFGRDFISEGIATLVRILLSDAAHPPMQARGGEGGNIGERVTPFVYGLVERSNVQ